MYIGDGMNVGAHIAETGGVYGQPGDQTGNEISVTPNYGNWDYVLCPPIDDEHHDEESEFDMTEAIFHCDDAHGGYPKDAMVYWNPTAGFCYLEDMDCVHLIKECSPGIKEINSSKKAPWIYRARQATNPSVAAKTYGMLN